MSIPATLLERFCQTAARAGAEVVRCVSTSAATDYLVRHAGGTILVPDFADARRLALVGRLQDRGGKVVCGDLFRTTATAAAGVSCANFGLADTGTLVLEASAQDVQLTCTLPERHFVLLHPTKILPDHMAATPLLRRLHSRQSPDFIAFITGPSRTADTKRMLPAAPRGPRELHILLLETLSDDFLHS
ncbi:protein of unknown function, DUF162-containing [Syntrophotalea carbinolica DSM 2380]|uniref:LUD domain-containing protein n=1 Tax=Syntrophotalea carbinolica (strain DSM 2380 / NBRC 103641 / GraBd1) TaxID=338963 RepID=Q39ZY5_SYNC1|nr:LUD domain-containing protein [Syntrophotalea carbinolica]ABA90322.1 protein of unknown function, DUF162-containing [Syntrophotalea carbinolica DSM 2380]